MDNYAVSRLDQRANVVFKSDVDVLLGQDVLELAATLGRDKYCVFPASRLPRTRRMLRFDPPDDSGPGCCPLRRASRRWRRYSTPIRGRGSSSSADRFGVRPWGSRSRIWMSGPTGRSGPSARGSAARPSVACSGHLGRGRSAIEAGHYGTGTKESRQAVRNEWPAGGRAALPARKTYCDFIKERTQRVCGWWWQGRGAVRRRRHQLDAYRLAVNSARLAAPRDRLGRGDRRKPMESCLGLDVGLDLLVPAAHCAGVMA